MQLRKYAQFGEDKIVYSITDSTVPIVGANIVEVGDDSCMGKKWDGAKFIAVPAPVRYKIWSKPDFILTVGKAAFDIITDGADKDLRFAKYVLDSADSVDMNNPQYVALVDMLRAKNIIDAAKLAALKVQV